MDALDSAARISRSSAWRQRTISTGFSGVSSVADVSPVEP